MKFYRLASILLLGALVLALFSRQSIKTQYEDNLQQQQDSLSLYAAILTEGRNSLDYHRALETATQQLLFSQPDTAAIWYAKADDLMPGRFRWAETFRGFINTQNGMAQTAMYLRQEVSALQEAAQKSDSLSTFLRNELLLRTRKADALEDKLTEMNRTLSETNFAKAELEAQLEEIRNASGRLSFLNTEGKQVSYYGQIADGKASGFGMGIFNGRSMYEGEWKNNLRHGLGRYIWPNGDIYEGAFLEGKRHGYGVYLFASGEKYEGEWKNDVRDGKGAIYDKDGKVLVEGLWRADKPLKEKEKEGKG